jgi:hypothetical protein
MKMAYLLYMQYLRFLGGLLMPALIINPGDPIFIGAFWGLVLALPISLFLAYWISAVKNHLAVVFGALVGDIIAFLIMLSWLDTLIFPTPPVSANGAATFFSSVLFCSTLGLVGGIVTDLLIARRTRRAYLRQFSQE